MVDIIKKVLTPPDSIDLMTLAEARLMILNMPGGIPPTDEQLAQMITQYSALVATLCNRVLGYQTMRETWRDFEPLYNNFASRRLFLSMWPVVETDITSVQAPLGTVLDPSTYAIEELPGKIEILNGGGSDPIVVDYSGGYKLPDEAPPELKQAVGLMIRQYRFQNVLASGVRSVSHKESRVQYFSPRDMLAVQPVSGGVNITSTIDNLLSHYRRVEI
jgi:hypothetical protein